MKKIIIIFLLLIPFSAIAKENNILEENKKIMDSNENYNKYLDKANYYIKNSDLENAIKEFTKAIEIKPNKPELYFQRGNCYEKSEDFTLAINDAILAFELDSTRKEYESNLKNKIELYLLDYNTQDKFLLEKANSKGKVGEFISNLIIKQSLNLEKRLEKSNKEDNDDSMLDLLKIIQFLELSSQLNQVSKKDKEIIKAFIDVLSILFEDHESKEITKEDIYEAVKKSGLERIWKDLEPELRNSILLDYKVVKDSDIKIGESKFGGLPDLPDEIKWPESNKNIPMSFVAQLNLKDIKKYDSNNVLPDKGILYFFFDMALLDDKNEFKVIYLENTDNLSRKKEPYLDNDIKEKEEIYRIIFETGKLSFKNSYSAPQYEHEFFNEFKSKHKILDSEISKYSDEVNFQNYNLKLGYSLSIQENNMEAINEIIRNNYKYSEEVYKKASTQWRRWILLLQVDFNEDLDMCWGDGGMLYFWIRDDDLKEKRFDKTILHFQYH